LASDANHPQPSVPSAEAPDISSHNCVTKSSQEEDQFAVPRFPFFLIIFSPERLFAFTKNQFNVASDLTRL